MPDRSLTDGAYCPPDFPPLHLVPRLREALHTAGVPLWTRALLAEAEEALTQVYRELHYHDPQLATSRPLYQLVDRQIDRERIRRDDDRTLRPASNYHASEGPVLWYVVEHGVIRPKPPAYGTPEQVRGRGRPRYTHYLPLPMVAVGRLSLLLDDTVEDAPR